MRKKINKLASGFTLFEVVTTMAIMVVIFSLAIAELKPTNSKSSLTLITEKLVSDLRATALSAFNAKTLQLKSPTGWGVYIETNATSSTYTIFADLNNNNLYDNEEKFKTVVLTNNIAIVCASLATTPLVCESAPTLIFKVPTAKTYFNGIELASGENKVLIKVEDIASLATKNILVNSLGVVSFQ